MESTHARLEAYQQHVFSPLINSCIVVMKKTPNTITDEDREDIYDRDYAHFHANKLEVIDIINIDNKDGKEIAIKSITSDIEGYSFTYTLGETVVADQFTSNKNDEPIEGCRGICYYTKYTIPYYFSRQEQDVIDGCIRHWYMNGRLKEVYTKKDGNAHGKYISYFENGDPCLKCTYVNEILHGKYERYWAPDRLFIRTTYHMGTPVGDMEKYNYDQEVWSDKDDERYWTFADI